MSAPAPTSPPSGERKAVPPGRRTTATLFEVLGLSDEQVRAHHERVARAFAAIREAERKVWSR